MTPTKVPMDVTDSPVTKKLQNKLKRVTKKIGKLDKKLGRQEQKVSITSGKISKAHVKVAKIKEALNELLQDDILGKKKQARAS